MPASLVQRSATAVLALFGASATEIAAKAQDISISAPWAGQALQPIAAKRSATPYFLDMGKSGNAKNRVAKVNSAPKTDIVVPSANQPVLKKPVASAADTSLAIGTAASAPLLTIAKPVKNFEFSVEAVGGFIPMGLASGYIKKLSPLVKSTTNAETAGVAVEGDYHLTNKLSLFTGLSYEMIVNGGKIGLDIGALINSVATPYAVGNPTIPVYGTALTQSQRNDIVKYGTGALNAVPTFAGAAAAAITRGSTSLTVPPSVQNDLSKLGSLADTAIALVNTAVASRINTAAAALNSQIGQAQKSVYGDLANVANSLDTVAGKPAPVVAGIGTPTSITNATGVWAKTGQLLASQITAFAATLDKTPGASLTKGYGGSALSSGAALVNSATAAPSSAAKQFGAPTFLSHFAGTLNDGGTTAANRVRNAGQAIGISAQVTGTVTRGDGALSNINNKAANFATKGIDVGVNTVNNAKATIPLSWAKSAVPALTGVATSKLPATVATVLQATQKGTLPYNFSNAEATAIANFRNPTLDTTGTSFVELPIGVKYDVLPGISLKGDVFAQLMQVKASVCEPSTTGYYSGTVAGVQIGATISTPALCLGKNETFGGLGGGVGLQIAPLETIGAMIKWTPPANLTAVFDVGAKGSYSKVMGDSVGPTKLPMAELNVRGGVKYTFSSPRF